MCIKVFLDKSSYFIICDPAEVNGPFTELEVGEKVLKETKDTGGQCLSWGMG